MDRCDCMSRFWFRPQTYGYGARPSNWRGWAAIGGYVGAIVALTLPLSARPAELPSSAAAWQFGTWLVMVVFLTFGFIRLCRGRTDGH